MKELLSETIEDFMISVPGNPQEGERDWSSGDMATFILNRLAENGCVRLSTNQDMPRITEEIAKTALALVKGGADLFLAGAGGMWEAVKANGFRKLDAITTNRKDKS